MSQILNSKPYDLEERTFEFAKSCREYIKKLPRNTTNSVYGEQLARSSGSQAANYIEANESLSKRDFLMRVRISKKETKESKLWIRLSEPCLEKEDDQLALIEECDQLMRIFGAIIEKSKT